MPRRWPTACGGKTEYEVSRSKGLPFHNPGVETVKVSTYATTIGKNNSQNWVHRLP
jgi:hypothetical protein